MTTWRPIPDFHERLATLTKRWAENTDVAAAYLYGSRARGNFHAQSDVDLAVILDATLSPADRWKTRLSLIDQAASVLATDAVDLLLLEEAPAPVAHRAIRDGRLLVDRDPRRRVEVVEDVLRRYLDEAWLRRELDDGLRARLAEGRFAR